MRRTNNAQLFLTGVVLLPIGWVLGWPIGGRFSKPAYRSDEDLFALLALCDGLLVLLGIALIVVAVFRALRKIDKLAAADLQVPAGALIQ